MTLENEVIARQIEFEASNTIELSPKLWNNQPVGAFTRDVVFYGIITAILVLGAFLLITPHTLEWIIVAAGATLLIAVGSLLLRNSLVENHRTKHLDYRKLVMSDLADFLKSYGYVLSETEQNLLTTMMKPNFQVTTVTGVSYRTSGLRIVEDKISATFYLSDVKVDNALRKADRENRIERIVKAYEQEHGTFASPDLREAFTHGLRRGLR